METVSTLLGYDTPAVDADATLVDAETVLRARGGDAVAVERGGRFRGLVLADDLAAARPSMATTLTFGEVNGALMRIPVTAIMRRDVATIALETPIAEAARLVRDTGTPVAVLAGDSLVGLVGPHDLLAALERVEEDPRPE